MKVDLECFDEKYQFVMKLIYYVALVAAVGALVMPRTIFYYREPIYKVKVGGLNSYDVVLKVNETYRLYIFAINKRVSYESSDFKVASVNLNGSIRAWRPGTAIIRVTYDEEILKCRVRVVDLNKHSMRLSVGEKCQLNVKNAWFGVRYRSSDSSVARVDSFGKVTGVGKGTTTIIANYEGKKMTCKVTIE